MVLWIGTHLIQKKGIEKNMALMPTIFVSHGMPAIVVQPGPTHEFLKKLGLGKSLAAP